MQQHFFLTAVLCYALNRSLLLLLRSQTWRTDFFQISLKYFESAADGQLFGNIWNWFSGTAGTKMLCQQEFLNRVGGRWDYRNLFQMTYWVEVVKRINFLPELWNWNSAILPCQTEYRHSINDLKSNCFKKKMDTKDNWKDAQMFCGIGSGGAHRCGRKSLESGWWMESNQEDFLQGRGQSSRTQQSAQQNTMVPHLSPCCSEMWLKLYSAYGYRYIIVTYSRIQWKSMFCMLFKQIIPYVSTIQTRQNTVSAKTLQNMVLQL